MWICWWHGVLGIVGLIIMVVVIGVILLSLQDVNKFKDLLARKVSKKRIVNSPSPAIGSSATSNMKTDKMVRTAISRSSMISVLKMHYCIIAMARTLSAMWS